MTSKAGKAADDVGDGQTTRVARRVIQPAVYTAAEMFARGHTAEVIAKRVNRSVATVNRWLTLHHDVVRDASKSVASPAELLHDLIPLAVRVQRATLELNANNSRDRAVQAQVADSVLDRIYGKPTQRTEIDQRTDVRVAFVNITPPSGQDMAISSGPASDTGRDGDDQAPE